MSRFYQHTYHWREAAAMRRVRSVLPRTSTVAAAAALTALVVVEVTTHAPSTRLRSTQAYHDAADDVVTPLMRRFLNPESEYHCHLSNTVPCIIICCIAWRVEVCECILPSHGHAVV